MNSGGNSGQLHRHLHVALNAAARSVAEPHHYHASVCTQFKLAMLVYKSLDGLAPYYTSDDLRRDGVLYLVKILNNVLIKC